jgi:hypothetical protein
VNVSQLRLRSEKFDDDDDDDNNNNNKLFKLQIRPPSLFLLITYPRIGECFPAEAEK